MDTTTTTKILTPDTMVGTIGRRFVLKCLGDEKLWGPQLTFSGPTKQTPSPRPEREEANVATYGKSM